MESKEKRADASNLVRPRVQSQSQPPLEEDVPTTLWPVDVDVDVDTDGGDSTKEQQRQ